MSDQIIEVSGRYIIRPTEETDFDDVLRLYQAWDIRIDGLSLTDAVDLRQEWDAPHFELSKSARVAHDMTGRLIGYCQVGHEQEKPVRSGVYVSLDADNPDEELGLRLFEWGVQELHRVLPLVPDHAKVTITTDADTRDQFSMDLIEKAGFQASGQVWQKMLIEMDAQPEPVYLDPAVTFITADQFNDDRAIYEAHQDAFRDHRNFIARDRDEGFKRWSYWLKGDERVYDPSLWLIALIDGEIAGVALCDRYHSSYPDEGYISVLGVRREYRGRGIAKSLLNRAFRQFWERGTKKACLFVDGSSITGADKLYRSVGMHVSKGYATYEKVLRDGEELSVQ
jgi:mycothiol synthase